MMEPISVEKTYTGEWLSMYKVTYRDNDGNTKVYEMVSKSGTLRNPGLLDIDSIGNKSIAVVMAVFNSDMSKILLCKEFRMGVNQYIYNFPAGLKEPGESSEDAAIRELKEETGLDTVEITRTLEPTFTCAPVTDDVTDFVILKAFGNIRDSNNVNEEIHSQWYTKTEAMELLNNSKIKFAGRTQAFCYMWAMSNLGDKVN